MTMLIDQLQPRYDARLLHHADLPQPPAVVRQAMEQVTLADLPALGVLVRIRSLGRHAERNPEPIFSGMRHADFVHVEEAGDEIAAAMAGTLWRIRQPVRLRDAGDRSQRSEVRPQVPALLAADRPAWGQGVRPEPRCCHPQEVPLSLGHGRVRFTSWFPGTVSTV